MSESFPKIALLGNPNAGKSSLFNLLTGLNQKIGNFAGVTVDKKIGYYKTTLGDQLEILDLPGTYSIYPKSYDERVVFEVLYDPQNPDYPDYLLVVADASNLRRNLLLFSQLADLEFPIILVLTMNDVAESNGHLVDEIKLSELLGVEVIKINSRSKEGIDQLKIKLQKKDFKKPKKLYNYELISADVIASIKKVVPVQNDYKIVLLAHLYENINSISLDEKHELKKILTSSGYNSKTNQARETIKRYEAINLIADQVIIASNKTKSQTYTDFLDKIFTHSIGGYLSFLIILFLVFQAIFSWASYPMDLIDGGIGLLNTFISAKLGDGPLVRLLTEGLISGLGGVLIFVPQIALLFMFIAVLEESGYMARVMFIMDKIMRQFGMSGRSIIPLVSGVACAVPAIMAARNIDSRRDRLITIFVTPLISCSARIPVFTVLIALIVPSKMILGIFNLQGLALMGCYLLGFLAALFTATVLKKILQKEESSYFIMELPSYKLPRIKNIWLTITEKVKTFVLDAGKVIIAISIILWVLASYGPGNSLANAEIQAINESQKSEITYEELKVLIESKKLEASYAGQFGKFIEPAIRPMGFDWKIGIALITSFAAREVFVGTMSTIYSIGQSDENNGTIIKKMKAEIRPETNKPMYDLPLSLSLLVFYTFAMQCMSTLAVTYRETKTMLWPFLQLFYMTSLAYISSILIYQLLT